MKYTVVVLSVVCLVISGLVGYAKYARIPALLNENAGLRAKLDSVDLYYGTLAVMEKTLLVAYPNISKYEAKYYSYVFYDFSKQYAMDWTWYPSMIWAESNWNHTLMSKKKARNITQLIPKCARGQAARLGIRYKEGYTEWNEINILVMGVDYLAQGFSSGPDYAIRRYIGGPGFMKASDSNKVVIEKYSKDVKSEQAKVDSIFREHEKLFYLSEGVLHSLGGRR